MNNQPNEFDEFRFLVTKNKDLFSLIWRVGDGCGAWAIDEIQSIIGSHNKKETTNKKYKKKKINGATRTIVMERDEYRCKSCGTHKDLTLDHIIPEAIGGSSCASNLQTLCRSCNSKKGVSQ